jgi:hypothetical protein
MAEENLIGLAELIQKVKYELLNSDPAQQDEAPVLWVNAVELELQVTVKRDVKAGLKVYVFEGGGGASRDEVQKVKISLTPILTREEIRKIYQDKHPEKVREIFEKSLNMTKGNLEGLDPSLADD